MNEPGSGESSVASCRARVRCFCALKRWKSSAAKRAETCPVSGVSEVSEARSGGEAVGHVQAMGEGARKAGSKRSPGTKGTGKVAGVDLKSW